MPLPPLADLLQFEDWVEGDFGITDLQIESWLRSASALVRRRARRTWANDEGELEDVPEDVIGIVLQVVERKWRNPTGVVQDTSGPFTVRWSERTPDGLYLTDDEKEVLDGYRAKSGLWTQRVDKDDPYLAELVRDTVFVPDASGGDPIPWETPL